MIRLSVVFGDAKHLKEEIGKLKKEQEETGHRLGQLEARTRKLEQRWANTDEINDLRGRMSNEK